MVGKMQQSPPNRRYELDWLRVFAMFVIFLFHCARFFDSDDWHVKNMQSDAVISIFVLFSVQWIMPLFFILSGISTYYSLSFRSAGAFVRSRFKRLVIPLVFGIFVLVPPQVYIERVSHFQFSGSYFQFYPHYLDGFYAFGGNFAWMGLHLWYLLILFVFSILTLPLFIYLRRPGPQGFTSKATSRFNHRGLLFSLALPLAILEIVLDPTGIGRRDFGGWSLFLYMIFFLYGYVLFPNRRIRETIEASRILTLSCAIATTVVALICELTIGFPGYGNSAYFIGLTVLRAFIAWFWLLCIVGFGCRYFRFSNNFLRYANQAVLPFYILHQTIIVAICFYLINWDINVYLKYLVIAGSSVAAILLIYQLIIKQLDVLRFLFGLKKKN